MSLNETNTDWFMGRAAEIRNLCVVLVIAVVGAVMEVHPQPTCQGRKFLRPYHSMCDSLNRKLNIHGLWSADKKFWQYWRGFFTAIFGVFVSTALCVRPRFFVQQWAGKDSQCRVIGRSVGLIIDTHPNIWKKGDWVFFTTPNREVSCCESQIEQTKITIIVVSSSPPEVVWGSGIAEVHRIVKPVSAANSGGTVGSGVPHTGDVWPEEKSKHSSSCETNIKGKELCKRQNCSEHVHVCGAVATWRPHIRGTGVPETEHPTKWDSLTSLEFYPLLQISETNETWGCEWECSHRIKATSKELSANLCVRVQCGLGQRGSTSLQRMICRFRFCKSHFGRFHFCRNCPCRNRQSDVPPTNLKTVRLLLRGNWYKAMFLPESQRKKEKQVEREREREREHRDQRNVAEPCFKVDSSIFWFYGLSCKSISLSETPPSVLNTNNWHLPTLPNRKHTKRMRECNVPVMSMSWQTPNAYIL